LYYRPPYDWQHLQQFYAARLIEGLEWTEENSYGRTFFFEDNLEDNTSKKNTQINCKGHFTAHHNHDKHRFDVTIVIDDISHLKSVVNNIRRILDLDTDSNTIEQCLNSSGFHNHTKGLRLPGTWSLLEAGIRAILGQQISVVAACNLVKSVINELGEKTTDGKIYFPSVQALANTDYSFIKMPGKRKETLRSLANHFIHSESANNPDTWLDLKGVGPWTIDYAKMRGLSDPDIYLIGDLGVKKAMDTLGLKLDPAKASPFRSYLTFQLWNKL
ncbi:MAG: AlkA N-terminal domain-containing protein, partial [Cocleimonas sp.]